MKNAAMVNEKCACGHKAEDHAKNGTGECVDCYSPETGATECTKFWAPKGARVVVAQVWHVKDVQSDGYSLLSKISWGECEINFPNNHELVADLKINADAKDVPFGVLDKAFELTNNRDTSWVRNVEGAILPAPMMFGRPGRRSTSVGDVVAVAGIAYVCAPMGWQKIVSADQKIVRGAL